MDPDETRYQALQARISRVPCPYRLFPARLRALGIAINKDLLEEIDHVIAADLESHFGSAYRMQFLRDLDTYGLHEAIVYFHSYDFPSDPTAFLERACALYDRIAEEYMKNHLALRDSDDPRIQYQLESIRYFGGDSSYPTPGIRFPPLQDPPATSSPEAAQPRIRPEQLQPHPELRDVVEGFFGVENWTPAPADLPSALIEQLGARFTFESFPGLQLVLFEVSDVLQDFGVHPLSEEGQRVLEGIIEAMNQDMFGDFERWLPCNQCGEDFMPDITPEIAVEVLRQGMWVCPNCAGSSPVLNPNKPTIEEKDVNSQG
jgi:hypothetical protein